MNGFEAYRTYLAVKRHFTGNGYDYHRYNGKVNFSPSSYEARRDRMHFERLAKKHPLDLVDYLVTVFLTDPKAWVGSIVTNPTMEKEHAKRRGRIDSFSREIVIELEKLGDDNTPSKLFLFGKRQHPLVVFKTLSGELSIETLVVLDRLFGLRERWEARLANDPVWCELRTRIEKYDGFLKVDMAKAKTALLEMWGRRTGT